MSLLLYLCLSNVGLGVGCGLWLGSRCRYIRRQLRAGYDLRILSPPTQVRCLWFLTQRKVDVESVCRRLHVASAGASQTYPSLAKPSIDTVSGTAPHADTVPVTAPQVDEQESMTTHVSITNIAPVSETTRPRNELLVSIEEHFLQRAAWIDQSLQSLIQNHELDTEPPIGQIATQLSHAQHWWTEFEGKLGNFLSDVPPADAPKTQRDQLDDDLIDMHDCLVECQTLLESVKPKPRQNDINSAKSHNRTEPVPVQVRARLMQATKACHRLRDNLELILPTTSQHFNHSKLQPIEENSSVPKSFVKEFGFPGLSKVLQQWQQSGSPESPSLASLLLIDVDQTEHWNCELGLESMNTMLELAHQQIAECIRSNRGFDRVVRLSGQQYVVLLGSTAGQSARYAAERLRDVFARTVWQTNEREVVIHISTAIKEFQKNIPLSQQVMQLQKGVAACKQAGGNTVFIVSADGSFAQVTDVPRYSLPTRAHNLPQLKPVTLDPNTLTDANKKGLLPV